jgi:hypothetical protein
MAHRITVLPPSSGSKSNRRKPGICLDELRKITKNLGHDNQYHGRDSNWTPLEYTLEVLLLELFLYVYASCDTQRTFLGKRTAALPVRESRKVARTTSVENKDSLSLQASKRLANR